MAIYKLTLPMNKFRGFSGYAQAIASRYRLKGLPDPIKKFLCFSGSDFTQKPNFCNHQPKLLKSCDRPALSLFYFFRYWSIQIIGCIMAQFKKIVKPYRASPDSSPVLKYGVFSGVFISDINSDMSIEFKTKNNGLIQIIMSEPENNYTGGCITIQESDLKEVALVIFKDKVKEKFGTRKG